MAQGKQTCKILKEIRQQIAKANDIKFVTSECRYKGDCLGTCPKCEAEVRYLEQQLHARRLAGKSVVLAGISLSALSMITPIYSTAQVQSTLPELGNDSVVIFTPIERVTIKGIVFGIPSDYDNVVEKCDTLLGTIVRNLNTAKTVFSDIDGCFEIEACCGDSIEFAYIGYESQTITITDTSSFLNITLKTASALMGEVAVLEGVIAPPFDRKHMLDLYIVDENEKPIDLYDIYVERIFFDEDGDEDWEDLSPEIIKEKRLLRLYWNDDMGLKDENGNALKKATLRIEADGYEDAVIIKVKYPKRHTKKTIKFKHKKR